MYYLDQLLQLQHRMQWYNSPLPPQDLKEMKESEWETYLPFRTLHNNTLSTSFSLSLTKFSMFSHQMRPHFQNFIPKRSCNILYLNKISSISRVTPVGFKMRQEKPSPRVKNMLRSLKIRALTCVAKDGRSICLAEPKPEL